MPPAAESFEVGVSPGLPMRTGGLGGLGVGSGSGPVPGPDSHRSFAGALDGLGRGGDPLDGFVVHSRFVRVDAPVGENEGGGLVPQVGLVQCMMDGRMDPRQHTMLHLSSTQSAVKYPKHCCYQRGDRGAPVSEFEPPVPDRGAVYVLTLRHSTTAPS